MKGKKKNEEEKKATEETASTETIVPDIKNPKNLTINVDDEST
jgi:hypothetical protein